MNQYFYCWFSHDVTKIQTTKLSILPRFYFDDVLEQLKTNFHTNFRFKRFLGFVIEYAWISKLLHNAAFTWRLRELPCRLKKMTYVREFCYLNSSRIKKYYFNVYEFLEERIHAFAAKLDNRCCRWFPSAMLVPIRMSTSMASPYKSL